MTTPEINPAPSADPVYDMARWLSPKAQEALRPPRRRRIRHDQGDAFLIADPCGFLNFMGTWAGANGGKDFFPGTALIFVQNEADDRDAWILQGRPEQGVKQSRGLVHGKADIEPGHLAAGVSQEFRADLADPVRPDEHGIGRQETHFDFAQTHLDCR